MADDRDARIAELEAEVTQRDRALANALEQQRATAEILRIIATPQSELLHVLDAMAARAYRLCGATSARVYLIDGDVLRIVTSVAESDAALGDAATVAVPGYTAALSRQNMVGRTALDGQVVHIEDADAPEVREEFPFATLGSGFPRTRLHVPLGRDGTTIGVLAVARLEFAPFSRAEIALLETFADQAVIAIENARLFSALQDRTTELTQALERQTAVGEVLRMIASSPTDAGPVLETIAQSAMQLSDSSQAMLMIREGEHLVRRATVGEGAQSRASELAQRWPLTARRVSVAAFLERRTIHVPDRSDPAYHAAFPDSRARAAVATVVVPLVHDQEAIGVLFVGRRVARGYSSSEIALVEAFADQAAIAIANARLFQDLQESNRQVTEALEQQTATAEVLRVIASSPTDLQQVLDAIVRSVSRLCDAPDVTIMRPEGERLRPVAVCGPTAEALVSHSRQGPLLARTSVAGRAYLDGRTVHVHDLMEEGETEYPHSLQAAIRFGYRTRLATPLLRDGRSIGVIAVYRPEVRPFDEDRIQLLETFADQAVIAIENARLFEALEQRNAELQESNRQVTEALEQQTVTAEVLRVIASAPTDLQSVLDAIAESAARVCSANDAVIYRIEQGGVTRIVAAHGPIPKRRVGEQARNLIRESVPGRAMLDRRTVHLDDIQSVEGAEFPFSRELQRGFGSRTNLATPLLREGVALGAILIRRTVVRPFTTRQIEMLETFADQAVIAIENARLFQEIQEKSRLLEEASQHKSQFLANMSHELRTPLNAIIGYSEMLQEEVEDTGDEVYLSDLQRINAAGKHLLGLINDILDLSKIEAGRMDLYLETFDVGQLVRDVEAIVQPLVEKNGNTLVVSCPDDLGSMHADQTKLRQALFNLLSNAAKFTERGTIILTVRREDAPTPDPSPLRGRGETGESNPPPPAAGEGERMPGDSPSPAHGRGGRGVRGDLGGGRAISFAVTDTGIGMTEEQLSRLFEAFSQAEASTRSKYGGTGLGLAISRHFCRLMGGELIVTSVYGQGSTFTVQLPAQVSQPAS